MMKIIKRFLHSRRSNGQAGQALILVLIFLAMGSLTLVPTLSHISTALKTGEIYEENTDELYTADAGIEDSLWRIKYDYMGPDYDAYNFIDAFPYQTENLNGMTANFTIMNVWFATDFNLADTDAPEYIEPDEVRAMMDLEKLIVNGSNDLSDNVTPYTYKIMVDFNPGAGDNLTIKSLGVWLPSGFTYVADSCSLQAGGQFTDYNPDEIVIDPEAPGGSTVLWSYDADYPYLTDFPDYNPGDNTFVFTLSYTKENPNWWPAAIAWVTTEMHDQYGNPKFPQDAPENVPVSWDIDTRYFKMVSAANDTSVEAYTSKNDLRQMGDAMAGDYAAIGNALLTDDDGDHVRDDWHTPSSFTLDSIPETAEAVYAYLYWTGWIEEDDIDDVFYDNCSDFDEWDRSSSPDSQTTVPTAEGINSGSWSYTPSTPTNYWDHVNETTPDDNDFITGSGGSQVRVPAGDYGGSGFSGYPYWSKVDETTPNDGDYITGETNGGYRLFNFDEFSVPSGSTINNLTVYFRARDVSGGSNNLRARLRVDGNTYNASSGVDPTTTWETYSYSWDENPRTGNPWTRDDINGESYNPLQCFGVYGTDFYPDIRVSMVYARVDFSGGGGYRLFDFQDFTVPDNSEVDGLTVYFRAMDASSGTNNLRASIYVHNTRYDATTSIDPGASWTTYSYTWDENPETGNPWTWQEVNGGSSVPLLEFGVHSSDLDPGIQISMVYATVTYFESRWTIEDDSNDNFQGQGSTSSDPEAKILTLKDSLNLSTAGVYSISWDQDEGGNLAQEDIFSFAFSGDGGDTWSPYYVAFYGNDPASPFSYPVPDEYKTNDFKIRFYFNFNAASEFVYMDNIEITYLPVDTDVVFKINDQQVYLDGDNQPQIGLQKITAERSYAMRNTLSGWGGPQPHGFSYACVRDVSALVKAFPVVPGEEHHTGNAKYTVGDVTADIRNEGSLSEIAFAGWSLIVVYASPESAGHYIYIRDENFYSHTSGDEDALDFDADGVPGGLITGFKIPDPITDKYGQIIETVAAKLTCFIVEGDSWYTGDYLEITGQQSGTSKYLSNSGSPWTNVWNNASYPGNYQGQDIDTFELYWDDGILTPGDNNLQVDLYSDTDAWNLVYFIISIRSETVTSGTSHYTIHGG